HPGLAKKLLAKQALEESDEDSAEQIPTTKAARIQEASQRVSKSSSSKPKKAVKVKEAVDTSDSDWDKRKEERVKRINKRAPTGHPGLAKKLLAKQTLEVDEQPRRKLQFTTVDSHESSSWHSEGRLELGAGVRQLASSSEAPKSGLRPPKQKQVGGCLDGDSRRCQVRR
ncbi:MAG: uncharacterized protein KVP18_005122, partial [Porospora cf. gigantea A]|uniref:uncharacterized protein n=1 Tax=Porospora cf. gigantea A TaxID=2853593 RepID=UPI00355A5694